MTPTFGSIVQNGKLAACAFALLKQLKRVDLPTFGKPTIPHFKAILKKLKVTMFRKSNSFTFYLNLGANILKSVGKHCYYL